MGGMHVAISIPSADKHLTTATNSLTVDRTITRQTAIEKIFNHNGKDRAIKGSP